MRGFRSWLAKQPLSSKRHDMLPSKLCRAARMDQLLGQGVLARFKSWSIDNEKGTITVVGPPINGEAVR